MRGKAIQLTFVNCKVDTKKQIPLDFVIDRLTNSIQNTISGDRFITEVLRLANADFKGLTKKEGWNFN